MRSAPKQKDAALDAQGVRAALDGACGDGARVALLGATFAFVHFADAVADWPILNALVNAVNGASWVSFHHGGGVGMGYSLHAGQVIVCDGTAEAARRVERVLLGDPAMGVLRHVDAGYERALEVARERGVKIPGRTD